MGVRTLREKGHFGHTWSYLGMPTVDILNAIGKEQRIAMHLHGYTLPLM